jgi:hypothetical protein
VATKLQTIGIVILGTIVAVAVGAQTPIGKAIWPPAAMDKEPTSAQMAGFVFAGLWEAAGFGAGIALTLALFRPFRSFAARTPWAWPAYGSLAWLNVTWVAHDNLHMHVGADPAGLVVLELVFHTTLIAAGLVVGVFLLKMAASAPAPASTVRAAAPQRTMPASR